MAVSAAMFTSYDVTGLSTVIGDDAPAYTADNEAYDPNALAAASPVLQLPAIVTVTNLVNGRSVEVRVNDRGPAMPGRVIAVTPRVAQLLDYPVGGVVEVRGDVGRTATAALDGALGAGPKLVAAPEASVTAQSLARARRRRGRRGAESEPRWTPPGVSVRPCSSRHRHHRGASARTAFRAGAGLWRD